MTERLLVFCFLMLMTAGAAASYAAHPATVTASVITMALPITVTFAVEDDVLHRTLAFAAVLYLAATFRSIKTLTYFFARTHRLAHELERERDRAEKLARTDELTGLNNRRAFYELCQAAIGQAKRYSHPASLLLADVDHFKAVNDAFGHAAGDEVLRVIAQLIREHHRSTDISGRLGGEEFAVLLTETPLSEALVMAERLRSEVDAHALHRDGATIRITLSVGVTALEDGQTLDQLIANSDVALYEAKRGGRNRVASSSPPPSHDGTARTHAE
jgi:diguanylate cyclase (GGDEF)-like protein